MPDMHIHAIVAALHVGSAGDVVLIETKGGDDGQEGYRC